MRRLLTKWVQQASKRVLVWSLIQEGMGAGKPKQAAARIAEQVVAGIAEAVRWQDGEQAILAERLSKRYDLGMALNESANRAMVAKRAAKTAEDAPQLTAAQLKALEFQKQFLQRVVERS